MREFESLRPSTYGALDARVPTRSRRLPVGGTNESDEPRTRNGRTALIDIKTVARMLAVSERYVRRLVFERRIEFVKVGHYVRFDPDAVDDWIEHRRQTPLASEDHWGVVGPMGRGRGVERVTRR
jgi:excisionase family DNA binding protein